MLCPLLCVGSIITVPIDGHMHIIKYGDSVVFDVPIKTPTYNIVPTQCYLRDLHKIKGSINIDAVDYQPHPGTTKSGTYNIERDREFQFVGRIGGIPYLQYEPIVFTNTSTIYTEDYGFAVMCIKAPI
jgi:hypothetical protein